MRYLTIGLSGLAALWWRAPPVVWLVYGLASLGCFALYAWDKHAARRAGPRLRERTLLLAALACGWPGALLAQQWLRHKSAKRRFLMRSWLVVLANLGAAAGLMRVLRG
jgi:uncharacterized membrane protein YsdA (DUF1294 family)